MENRDMKTKYYKFPKIFHFLWSENLQNEDRLLPDIKGFVNKRIIVSEKIDGENTSIYGNHIHARSIDSKDHPSRHWVKNLHARIKHEIPDGWRICGENCFALHSIYYTELPSYFLVFGVYNEKNEYLNWDDTVEICNMLGLIHVPVLYDGIWGENEVKKCFTGKSVYKGWKPNPAIYLSDVEGWDKETRENSDMDLSVNHFNIFRDLIVGKFPIEEFALETQEGYIVRIADSFHYDNFQKYNAKFVRKSHVQCSDFWMTQPVIRNKLKNGTR